MKSSNRFPHCRYRRTDAARRAKLLAAFDRSGLTAAGFARQQGLNYTTFCGWRHRRAKTKHLPGFVQVELPTPATPVPVVIEVGAGARIRIESAGQIELAADLLRCRLEKAPRPVKFCWPIGRRRAQSGSNTHGFQAFRKTNTGR